MDVWNALRLAGAEALGLPAWNIQIRKDWYGYSAWTPNGRMLGRFNNDGSLRGVS